MERPSLELAGMRSGMLVAKYRCGRDKKSGRILWACDCDCGATDVLFSASDIAPGRKRKPKTDCGCSRLYEFNGVKKTIKQWSVTTGMPFSTMHRRLKRLPVAKALRVCTWTTETLTRDKESSEASRTREDRGLSHVAPGWARVAKSLRGAQ